MYKNSRKITNELNSINNYIKFRPSRRQRKKGRKNCVHHPDYARTQ